MLFFFDWLSFIKICIRITHFVQDFRIWRKPPLLLSIQCHYTPVILKLRSCEVWAKIGFEESIYALKKEFLLDPIWPWPLLTNSIQSHCTPLDWFNFIKICQKIYILFMISEYEENFPLLSSFTYCNVFDMWW